MEVHQSGRLYIVAAGPCGHTFLCPCTDGKLQTTRGAHAWRLAVFAETGRPCAFEEQRRASWRRLSVQTRPSSGCCVTKTPVRVTQIDSVPQQYSSLIKLKTNTNESLARRCIKVLPGMYTQSCNARVWEAYRYLSEMKQCAHLPYRWSMRLDLFCQAQSLFTTLWIRPGKRHWSCRRLDIYSGVSLSLRSTPYVGCKPFYKLQRSAKA